MLSSSAESVFHCEANAGEGRIASDADDVFISAFQIAGRGESERRTDRRAGVSRAVAVVLALGAQGEAVESVGGANGVKSVFASGQ